MTTQNESTKDSNTKNESTKLSNATYDIISALSKDADFLYSTVGKYIEDAKKDGRDDLIEVWNTIRSDKERHVGMLREALSNEAKGQGLK
jgi:hypothetical protein